MPEETYTEVELKEAYTKEMIEKYVVYAQEMINQFKQARALADQNNLTPAQINTALAEYKKISDVLVIMYNQAKIEYMNEKEDYQCWFDEKYLDVRQELNPVGLSAQKWASTKELEAFVRVRNKEEYLDRKRNLDLLEVKVSTLRRINDNYKSFSHLLVAMANNTRAELSVLTLENRMNKPIENRRQPIRREDE